MLLNWKLVQLSNKVMKEVFSKTPKNYWKDDYA